MEINYTNYLNNLIYFANVSPLKLRTLFLKDYQSIYTSKTLYLAISIYNAVIYNTAIY